METSGALGVAAAISAAAVQPKGGAATRGPRSELRSRLSPVDPRPAPDQAGRHAAGCPGPDLGSGPDLRPGSAPGSDLRPEPRPDLGQGPDLVPEPNLTPGLNLGPGLDVVPGLDLGPGPDLVPGLNTGPGSAD